MSPVNPLRPFRRILGCGWPGGFALLGIMMVGSAWAQTQVYSSRPLAAPPPPHTSPTSISTSPAPGAAPPLVMDVPGSSAPRAPRIGRVAELVQGGTVWDLEQRRWTPLFQNRPVVAGDRLRSEAQGRVELQVGSLDVIMGPGSELEFPALDDSRVLVRLVQGSMVVRTRQAHWARTLELLTDEGRLQPLGLGLIRIDRERSPSRTTATALAGLWRLGDPGPVTDLPAGQRLTLESGSAVPVLTEAGPVAADAWSRWVAALDPMPPAPPLGEALPEITGADVLHRHGRWEQHPQWGAVWWPASVPPQWEPYRSGRWIWSPSGTWVWWEDAPWGFAPFHYGAWVQWGGRWVWAPRLHRPHPVPAPHRPRPPIWGAPTPVTPPAVVDEERSVRTPRWGRELEGPAVSRPMVPREPLSEPAPARPAPPLMVAPERPPLNRAVPERGVMDRPTGPSPVRPTPDQRGPRESAGERGRIAVQ